MNRLSSLLPALAACALLALPASAQTQPMSDADRAAFRAEVRAYLMENPEVIFEAVAEFERRTAEAQSGMDDTLVEINAAELFADGYSWVGGNPEGDLTLVEFMDYRCGFCRRAVPEVAALLDQDTGIRLVVKEFPILGPDSERMSRFAISALQLFGDDAYDRAHTALMEWDGTFTDTSVQLLAQDVDIDGAAILAHMDSAAVTEVIETNRALAQRMQISGTPTFIMGNGGAGQMLRGYLPADEMAQVASALRG